MFLMLQNFPTVLFKLISSEHPTILFFTDSIFTALKWEEVKSRVPEGVYAACHNAEDSVTISGPPPTIKEFTSKLTAEGIFAKEVQSSGIAFHSKYIADAGPKLRSNLERVC